MRSPLPVLPLLVLLSGGCFFSGLQAQDIPDFRYWLNGDTLVVAKGYGENLYAVSAADGGDTIYHAPVPLRDQLPRPYSRSRQWQGDATGKQLVLNHENDLYYFARGMEQVRRLTDDDAVEQNPTFSPDGNRIAFTREGDLFALDLASGTERRLTRTGNDTLYNGYASWVYHVEILGQSSRHRAFYWSPDSRSIAFLRFDDRPVPSFPIVHHVRGDSVHGSLQMTRYPKAGDALPRVTLHVVDLAGGTPKRVPAQNDLPYLAGVQWSPSGDALFFQQMNREQDALSLFRAPASGGSPRLLHQETRSTWVNFGDMRFLSDGRRFLWLSDRSGWQNIYLYEEGDSGLRPLTQVDWNVRAVKAVDEASGFVYFTGSGPGSTDQHLFRVKLSGDSLSALTRGAGHHRTFLSPDFRYFVDRHSRHNDPGSLTVFRTSGEKVVELARSEHDPNRQAGIFVEHFSVPLPDGRTLPAYWVLPPGFDPTQLHPLVFQVYGGPAAEAVHDRFRDFSRDPLVRNGVIRFSIDHRGSGKFGREGLDQLHRQLGRWEIHDYVEAVKWLREQTFVDASRIGIRGGSYGGYLAALAMTKAPEYFTHAVARAPVTDWRLYNNVYTERYMDRPDANPEGYRQASVLAHAQNLKGKLLLMHGTVDDNVHLQHTIQLTSRLQDQGKMFDLMIYPGGRHGWGGPQRRHADQLEEDFFLDHFYGNRGGAQ